MNFHHFDYQTLTDFTKRVFLRIGCSLEHAELATDVLIKADLRGVDSHGVARLSGYVRLWEKGRIQSKPQIKVVHETPSTATIDGDGGLGLVVAPFAMQIALEKAAQVGSGFVSVKNSNHFGIAAYHAMMAIEKDMIGISMTNASPLVAPTYANERLLGTNPMCYAFPAGEYPAVVVDMATAAAANGKLEIAQRAHQSIPTGWVQDKNGLASTNPNELKDGGSLLPLGSDKARGSHKGYGLSATVDIFSAILSGANYGPWVPPFVAFLDPPTDPVGEGIGHFLGAIRVDGFRPVSDYKYHMDNWIKRFKNAQTIDPNQPVIIPGEPELAFEKERKVQGIPLIEAVVQDLKSLAEKLEIEHPF